MKVKARPATPSVAADAATVRVQPVRAPGAGWVGLAATMAFVSLTLAAVGAVRPGGISALDWQPGLAWREPWRWWTAACLHWTPAHLAANLAALALLAAVGWRARASRRATLAWAIAWPLTQVLLDLPWPPGAVGTLAHYAGLSGVLHAGAVIIALDLWRPARRSAGPPAREAPPGRPEPPRPPHGAGRAPSGPGGPREAVRHRRVGALLLAGTLLKVVLERPWQPGLRPNALLGISVAPAAHACGVIAGLLGLLAMELAASVARRVA